MINYLPYGLWTEHTNVHYPIVSIQMSAKIRKSIQMLYRSNTIFFQVLDNFLVGKNDPADFSKAWRKKFSKHPSWCDADMCLQQINMVN
jgi:hypothetical protein